jgi:hypothetical protein
MGDYTEVIANRVLELEKKTRQLSSANSKLRASRDNWKQKAETAEMHHRQLAGKHRMLLIDKAHLIANQTVR